MKSAGIVFLLFIIILLAPASGAEKLGSATEQILTARQLRLKALWDSRIAAEKARLDALKARGPKPKMRNSELAKFDADRSGFLEPEEVAAYQADVARRKAEAAKK